MEENTSSDTGRPGRQQAVPRFAAGFALVLLLVGAIEVFPLFTGANPLPWSALWPEVSRRLPRMLLIAAAVAVFLTMGTKNKPADDRVGRSPK